MESMEYQDRNNYIQDVGQSAQTVVAPNQFVAQSGTSAFASRLGALDPQYQQRRSNSLGFDTNNNSNSSQIQNPNYNNGMNSGIMSDSYGSLQLGSYDSNNIIDWNNGSRSLGPIDGAQFGISQGNAVGIFQQSNINTNNNDWTSGLRGVPQSGSLSLQLSNSSNSNSNLQSYNLNDLTQFHSQQIALGMNAPTNNSSNNGTPNNLQMQQQQQQQSRNNNIGGTRYGQPGNNGNVGGGVHINSPRAGSNLGGYGGVSAALQNPGTGGSNAQGRALNKMLLDILRDRMVDPNRLAMAIDANIERMDCVNLATLLFHTGKKRLLLTPSFIKRIAIRFSTLKEELRAREASNALYGLKCMSSECPEVRQLVFALASKLAVSQTELVAQAVGNALYGCQMMTSEHEEVRYLLHMLSIKICQCNELLEAQNVGNALYGLRGMNSDCKEVRMIVAAITPKVATAREELNGQALGNSLYGLQGMNSREPEIRNLLSVLAMKVTRTWEDLKAQEVGNALYGLKRMNSDVAEVRHLVEALMPKVASSPEILDAQAIGNSFYGMQNMKSDNEPVLSLLATMADKVLLSPAELDGQAMGNSLYGLQGMKSDQSEVRAVVNAITMKIQASQLEMNAQELGNALYGLQNMSCDYPEIRRLLSALTQKVSASKHELTSQEIGNAIFGLQGMRSDCREVRQLVRQMATKIQQSSSLIDPQGIANSLFGLQRMSSDSDEVRLLLAALTAKIEHSWKVLSSQHISNSIFGLQGLCSAEAEVRGLIHALVPKVLASRDDMSPKQICYAIFGLKNMFAHHDEVRSMVGPLTEKLTLCTDPIPLQMLSLAFYGLQGMDSSFEDVRALLVTLCEKLGNVDEIDAFSVANIIFGFQRMSTTFIEVHNALELLSPMVMTLADAGLEIGAQVCANLIYGLQNCSCEEESVRRILFVALAFVKDLIAGFSITTSGSTGSGGDTSSANNGSVGSSNLSEAICIHQAISLSLQMLPGLSSDTDLNAEMRTMQEQIYRIIESRKGELTPCKLSVAEKRLADSISDILVDEPFIVTFGELLHGFESCITIRLRPGLSLVTKEGVEWSPVLNIEVAGPNDSCPREELFSRLRAQYLFQEMGVVVQTIPFASLSGQSRASLRDLLRRSNDLFNAIYPPTVEDATNFNTILSTMGLLKGEGLLSSLNNSESSNSNRYPLESSHMGNNGSGSGNNSNSTTTSHDAGSSFFSLGNGDVLVGNGVDDFDPIHPDEAVDFFDARMPVMSQRPFRQSFGMAVGWIGDAPIVSISSHTTPSSSPSANYSSSSNHVSNRRSPLSSKVYKTVSTSPMPPGYSARAVHPPFVQIGPPVQPTLIPSPLTTSSPTSSSNMSPRNLNVKQAPVSVKPSQVSYNPSNRVTVTVTNGVVGGVNSNGVSTTVTNGAALQSSVTTSEVEAVRTHAVSASATAPAVASASPGTDENDHVQAISAAKEEVEESTEVDSEIAFLEAQLEIKRLEAKLLVLKKAKTKVVTPTAAAATAPTVVPSTVALQPTASVAAVAQSASSVVEENQAQGSA